MSGTRPSRGAIVLAGGRSTRMGRDKASLPFGGTTLLGRVLAAVGPEVGEVVVVARRGQALPPLRAGGGAPVRVVFDDVEGFGPLGGLAPGLRALEAEVAFATSCDVPFLSGTVVRRLFEALGDAEIAIPRAAGFLHPLCAAYRRTVLPHVEALVAAGLLRPVFLLERVRHVEVSEDALRAVDPDLLSLANCNAPADYEAALARAGFTSPPSSP